MSYTTQSFMSPVGRLHLLDNGTALCGVYFDQTWPSVRERYQPVEESTPILDAARFQLEEYFAGERHDFDLPLAIEGTEFQRNVWLTLKRIPFGSTRTYKEQALLLGSPKAVRAVGRTNGLNPLSIILPCHRVIGSDGKLTGYAGGLPAKEFLLSFEGAKAV